MKFFNGALQASFLLFLFVGFFISCHSNNEDAKKGIDLPEIEWEFHKKGRLSFGVPPEWQKISKVDSILNLNLFRFYSDHYSGFFQIAYSKNSEGETVENQLFSELSELGSLSGLVIDSICVEEFDLINGDSLWVSKTELVQNEQSKTMHSLIYSASEYLVQLDCFIPTDWDHEWIKWLLNEIATQTKFNDKSFYDDRHKIVSRSIKCKVN